jgi:hypothetical protein
VTKRGAMDSPTTLSTVEEARRAPEVQRRGVTLRALLLGLAFVAAFSLLLPYLQDVKEGPDLGLGPVTGASILALLLVLGPVNGLLLLLRRRWGLTRQEILTVYCLVAATAAIGTVGYATFLTVMVTASQYFATPENRWDVFIRPHFPAWLQLNDPQAIRSLWESLPAGQPVPWRAWRMPVLAWGVVACCLHAGSFALLSLVRRDWIESQRLTFPLAQIPLEVVGSGEAPRSHLLRRRLFWAGFGLAFGYGLLGLLHSFYPAVPYGAMEWPLGRAFDRNVMPWGVANGVTFNLSFAGIGIMCLLPVEVSLSLWLFHVWYYCELIVLAALGFTGSSGGRYAFDPGTFFGYQTGGALVGFGVLVLYQSRRAIAAAVRSWWRPQYRERDPLDLLAPRYALVVLVLSLVGLSAFARAAGAQPGRLLALLFLYYTTALSLTRVIAAAGTNHVECGPQIRYLLDHGFGTAGAAPATFIVLNQMDAMWMTEFKVAFMHYAANDMKVFHSARVRGTSVVLALAAAVVLATFLSPWGRIYSGYHVGIGSLGQWVYDSVPRWEFGDMVDQLQNPQRPDPMAIIAMLSGGAVVAGLSALQMQLAWWRLSPVGFLLQGGWGINAVIWANALVGWVAVNVIYRTGGLRLYQQLRPSFFGLFLGAMTSALLSSAVRLMVGTVGR